MVCVRFTKKWPITKIQVRDILKILKGVCVGPSLKKVGGSSNAIKRVEPSRGVNSKQARRTVILNLLTQGVVCFIYSGENYISAK